MAKDFYIRDNSAPKYQDDILEISDPISFLLMQIEMLLFTNKTEMLGMPQFGINLEEDLFLFNVNEAQLMSKITTQIYAYCPLANDYKVNVDVGFIQGENRDIAMIDIYIEGYKELSVLL